HKLVDKDFVNQKTHFELSTLVVSYPDERTEVKLGLTDETQRQLHTTIYGNGVIDALYQGIEQLIGISFELQDYTIRSKNLGKDAVGEVIVKVNKDERSYTGRGMDTDIIKASAKAYLIAINQFLQDDRKFER